MSYKQLLAVQILLLNITYAYSCQIFNHPTEALAIVKPYLPDNPVVLEAGAYDGTDSIAISKNWAKATFHAFEPVPELYQKLSKKTKPFANINTYPFALGDYTGIAKFYVSEFENQPGIPSESSSLLKPKEHLIHAPHVVFKREISVPIMTIDSWAQAYGVDTIDFMWLDMQGYELNALKASPKIMKTVKAILTEVEFVEAYEGQYLFAEVKTWLEEQGFVMIARNFYCDWFGDALFVRK